MATESPLIHDGSQMTASEDLSPTAGLNGLNGSGQFLAVTISGSRTVAHAGTQGVAVYGILQNQPKSGQAADVGIFGISKAVAGASITANDPLETDSTGRVITGTSTDHRWATALESATAAGQIISVLIHGANRTTA